MGLVIDYINVVDNRYILTEGNKVFDTKSYKYMNERNGRISLKTKTGNFSNLRIANIIEWQREIKHYVNDIKTYGYKKLEYPGVIGEYLINISGDIINLKSCIRLSVYNTSRYLQVGLNTDEGFKQIVLAKILIFNYGNISDKLKVMDNDYTILYLDGNRLNISMDNLSVIKKSEMIEKGLNNIVRGEKANRAKYTEKQVRDICALLEDIKSPTMVYNIVKTKEDTRLRALIANLYNHRTWKHITKEYNW